MRISDWSSDVCSSDLCFVGFSIGRARSNPDPGALQSIDGAGALLGIAAPGARLCLARFQPLNNLGAGVERVRHGLDERATGFRPLRLFAAYMHDRKRIE